MSNRNPVQYRNSRCQIGNIPQNKYLPWWHRIQKQRMSYNSNSQHSYLSTSSDDPRSNSATRQKGQNKSFRNSNAKMKLKVTSIAEMQLTYHFQNTPSANSTMMSPGRLVCKALVTFLLFCILQKINQGTQQRFKQIRSLVRKHNNTNTLICHNS